MLVIGLTGGIGSGKTTVARLFAELGADVVDADTVAREVVLPGSRALAKISKRFGPDVLAADGSLNRPWLRETVFSDPRQRQWLEALLHPLIADRIRTHIACSQAPYLLLVSPLLVETDQRRMADRVLVVDVPEALQIERTLARDGGRRETIEAIMATQLPRRERLQEADDVLDNSGTLESVADRVRQLHEFYSKTARGHE